MLIALDAAGQRAPWNIGEDRTDGFVRFGPLRPG